MPSIRSLVAAVLVASLSLSTLPSHAATQTVSVSTGFNFVSFTAIDPAATSRTLMQANPSIVGVYRFNQTTKKYEAELNLGGGDFDGTAFSFEAGRGYILRATSAADLSIAGTAQAASSISLSTGFAIVGFLAPGRTSRTLMQENAAIVGVYRFDVANRRYVSDLNLGGGEFDGTPFDLLPGTGYVLRLTGALTLTSAAPTIAVGANPGGVAVTRDGLRALVTQANNPGTVSIVSLATRTVTGTITVGNSPRCITVTPDGSRAYVSNLNTVSVVNLTTNAVVGTITATVGTTLYDLAITPDGTRAVIGDLSPSGTKTGMDLITLANNAITFVAYVSGNGPFGVAVTPDGSSVLGTNGIVGTTVNRMSLLAGNAQTIISGTSSSFGVAVTPDGTSALVTSGEGDTVKRISLASNTVTATIPFESNQSVHNIAITPDGSRAVAVGNFNVGIIKLADNTVTTVSGGGGNVAITPDGKTALVTADDGGQGVLRVIALP